MGDRHLMRDHFSSNMAVHFYTFVPVMKDHLSYKTTFCGLVGWSLLTGFIVYIVWGYNKVTHYLVISSAGVTKCHVIVTAYRLAHCQQLEGPHSSLPFWPYYMSSARSIVHHAHV